MNQENRPERGQSWLSDDQLSDLGRVMAQGLPDAVILADRNNVVQYWNAGAERIFGFTSKEATGQSLDIIIPERLRARHREGFQHMMETGLSNHGPDELLSVPATTKSGEAISVQFTLAVFPGDGGEIKGIVAVLRDVTETFLELKRLRAATRKSSPSETPR